MLLKNKQIKSIDASKINAHNGFQVVTQSQIDAWNAKWDFALASHSAAGAISAAQFDKIEGIPDFVYDGRLATQGLHPDTHPATMIDQDATHRFVTDTEKATWDAKASTDAVVASASGVGGTDGLMIAADKEKLDGIEAEANKYVHPENHAPSMISQDENNRFVSDAEKATWNAKQNALGFTPLDAAKVGQANGAASLDSNGKVPVAQMPDTALGKTIIVADMAARDALDTSTWNTGDRVIVLDAGDPTNSREGYIFEVTQADPRQTTWHKDSDTDWANVNLSWTNIVDGPTVSVADINAVVGMKAQLEADHTKLESIAADAEVNQNAFATLSDGTNTTTSGSKTGTMLFKKGDNIDITVSDVDKSVTIGVTGKVASAAAADAATTAGKLTTARKIALTGDVTGEAMFDGSSDVSINATVTGLADHTHAIDDVTGLQTALDGKASTDLATTTKAGLQSAADKTKLDALVKRYAKTIVISIADTVATSGTINTGIKTDGSGGNFTDIVDLIALNVNGMTQTPVADYQVSEVSNELVITWLETWAIDSDDKVSVTYNQLG